MPTHRGGKSGSRKVGRNLNRSKCKLYKLYNRRDTNKRRKLLKHVAWMPNDAVAVKALQTLGR